MVFRILKPVLQALLQIAILLIAIVWVLDSGAQAMGYQWQWERVPDYIAFYEDGEWWPAELIEGLIVTLKISAISLFFTLVIGLVTALLRLSNSKVGNAIGTTYVELIRNTPL
ncbi:ABC transporter permease subunit, partial [Vibrio campbellii]